MRRRGNLRGLSRLISILLALGLLSGLFIPAAAESPQDGSALPLRQADEAGAETGAQADKNILEFALREAQKAVEDGLLDRLASSAPDGLRARFEAAVLNADEICRNGAAAYEEIQAAYLELQEVMWQLSYVQADKTALQAAVDHAAAIDLNGYTASSVQAFRTALEEARALLERDDLNMGHQQQIAAAVEDLKAAESGLTKASGGGSVVPAPPTQKPENPEEIDPDPTPIAPAPIKYIDVSDSSWYALSVEYVSSRGIMNGTGDERFSPKMPLSRAMIWTMLYRLAGEPEQEGENTRWYDSAMRWAMANGITDGTNPKNSITREQLAATLYRYAGSVKTDCDLSAYQDSAQISGWAEEGMMWAVSTGLIQGRGDGVLDPRGTATRAETAAIFMRFMKDLQDE